MATTMRASSFLPTITCSICSVEIPISHMGDHLCSQAPPIPEPQSRTLDGPFAPSTRPSMGATPSSLVRPGKTPPSRANTISTAVSVTSSSGSSLKNLVQVDDMPPPPRMPFSSTNTSSSPRSVSPVPSLSGRKSPHRQLLRSATAPFPSRPASPDAMPLPQDSAFPVFPIAKPRSTTPTTPLKSSFTFLPEKQEVRIPEGAPEEAYGLSDLRGNDGETLLHRVDSIAPEPFNTMGKADYGPTAGDEPDSSTVNNGQEFVRTSPTSSARSRVRRPSTSSSIYTRNPSTISMPGAPRFALDDDDVPAMPTVPSVALNYNQAPPQEEERPVKTYSTVASPFDFGMSFGQGNRSRTFPQDEPRSVKEEISDVQRRPSEPTLRSSNEEPQDAPRKTSDPTVQTHKPRPSVMLPLYEIGSTSSFKPSKSLRGRRTGSPAVGQSDTMLTTSNAASRDDKRLEDAPPVPPPSLSQNYITNNPYHTPHESVSSNESYGSGVRSGSSRSSPPLNESPLRPKGQELDNRFNDAFQGFQFGTESQPQYAESRAFASAPPTEPASIPPPPTAPPQSEQPTIPNLDIPPRPSSVRPTKPTPAPLRDIPARSNPAPLISPDDHLVSPFTDLARNTRISPGVSPGLPPSIPPPPPIPESPVRKRSAHSKGPCRGCNAPIHGKSISSADGQLTGRYHKQCFVCQTCRAPFQTIDFYVADNHPYCARHYHEINGSICTKCDRGIEGQYLETTESRQKFHAHCFTCQECHRILRDDFYEWNGRTLCEQHAFGDAQRAQQQPSSLGPGRRYPEKRTTRLMMM